MKHLIQFVSAAALCDATGVDTREPRVGSSHICHANGYDLALGDDFGADDLGDDMGADDLGDDEMGADRRGGKRRNKGWRNQPLQPDKQTQVMPFPRTSVAAATQAAITAFPQRPFQTKRLAWASTTAPNFTIEELKIGQDSMFVQAGSVEAEIFSQTGVGVALRGFIARPGVTITLVTTNQDAAAHAVGACIIGEAIV